MWLGIVQSVLRKLSPSSPTLDETIRDTAKSHLAKTAKLESAADAIYTQDLHEIATADRQRVADYAAATVPGLGKGKKGGKAVGDFIVCDDYRKGTGTLPAIVLGAVSVLALLLAGFAAWAAMKPKPEPPPPPAVEDRDTWSQVEIE